MGALYHLFDGCNKTVSSLSSQVESSNGGCVNITSDSLKSLMSFCGMIYDSEVQDVYSEPMVWIGVYITIASWFCILAMLADLFKGFKSKRLWFPCKYFSLNATSVTVITVAMKLPMDLSGQMPGYVDQAAKLASMAFMSTMMTNLMPSIASMDNKALAANVIGLVILVITMIVNVCIEISTGLIYDDLAISLATHFITMTILLLLILISSAITIPTSKQILTMKYQATSEKAINDQHPQHTTMPIVEKLRTYMRRHWVMAETGSPQFMMASSPLSFASGVICVIGVLIYISLLLPNLIKPRESAYGSQYKSTTFSILVTQTIGVMVGAVAPIYRCYMVLKWNTLMIIRVEEYWTQKLYEWKESDIPIISCGPRSRAFLHNFKKTTLTLWIIFQKVLVISCKMMVVIILYTSYCWRVMFSTTSVASSSDNTLEDVSGYVLQIEDVIRPTQEVLIDISKSLYHFTQKVENKQNIYLLKLLEKSSGFEGVKNFDNDQVQLLFSPRLANNWSLPVVSLTCIAITLPNIRRRVARSLLKSVHEGLLYSRMVEECLNNASEYVDIQRASITLWREVEDKYKWLGNTLETRAFKQKTPVEILTWFVDKAQENVREIINKSFNGGETINNPPKKLIAANSMYRIAQSILLNYQTNILSIREEELFGLISGMIADILAACLSNIPRVIMTKFNESAIDKIGASVEAAAKLLGRSSEIITRLEERQLPRMDPSKMAFIDEWSLHLNQPCVQLWTEV